MASAPKKQNNLVQFALIFLLVYFGSQLFFGNRQTNQLQAQPGLEMRGPSSVTIGHHPELKITNLPASSESHGPWGWVQSKFCGVTRAFGADASEQDCRALAVTETGEAYTLQDRCPEAPVDLYRVQNPGEASETLQKINSSETVTECHPVPTLHPGDTALVSLAPWKYSLFEQTGVYEARLPGSGSGTVAPTANGSGTIIASRDTVRFAINEPGVFTKMFRTFVTAPLLNFLILVASFTPGHNLGLAIILVTIVIKLLLFLPNQHAMEGQKKMQMLQPRLKELQKKYEGDQKRIQEETMKLWKEHKINPFSSCLPMLLQFPILIGLFYTVRDASNLTLSRHLTYDVFSNLSWHWDTHLLGLDLLKPEVIFFPIALVVLQFLQMKLTFAIQKRKSKKDAVVDVSAKKDDAASMQDTQQKLMLYGLPLMIGVFAIQMPSAVAIYWGVSTLFGIGQQMIVNREHLRV